MLGINHKALPVLDFSGGLKTRGSPYQGDTKKTAVTTPNCNGVYSTTGKTLQRMNGYTVITSDVKTGTANGIYNFTTTAGAHNQLVQFGTTMWYMSGYSGTLTSLQTGLADARAEFATFISSSGVRTMLYLNKNQETMRSWDGVAASMSSVASGPQAKFMKVWYNRVWTFNQSGAPNRLKWSDLNAPTTYSAGSVDDNFETPQGDEGTGMGILRGRMYIFKEKNIFRLSYVGGTQLFTNDLVTSGTGCAANQSIQNVQILTKTWEGVAAQEVLMFVTAEGRLVYFDGTYITPVSEAIEDDNNESPVSVPLINKTVLSSCHAVPYPNKHQYSIFIPIGSATTPSHLLAYDTYANGLWACNNHAFEASGVVKNSDGVEVPVGAKSGLLYELDRGNTHDGVAIDAYYTLDITDGGDNTLLKKGGHFEIDVKLRGSSELNVQHRNNWDGSFGIAKTFSLTGGARLGSTFILGSSALGGNRGGTLIYPFPYTCNSTQLKLSSTSTGESWEIYKIDFVISALGRAK